MDAITSTETLSPTPKRNKSQWLVNGLLTCAGIFIVATGLLGYQVGRSVKQLDVVRQELEAAQGSIDRLKEPSICNSKECVISAAALMEAMDPDVDPCQDFYQFACGGWLRKNSIPESSPRWYQFQYVREQVTQILKEALTEPNTINDSKPINNTREMYKACMDTEAIETLGLGPLTKLLNFHGNWPMTVSNWKANQFDWQTTSTFIRRDLGENVLFKVDNYPDWTDTDKISIFVDQSSLGLPYSTLINAKSNSTAQVMKAYADYVVQAAKVVRDSIDGRSTDSDIVREVEQMINFEIELAKIQTKPEERRNRTRMYNPMKLSELQRLTDNINKTTSTGHINWTDYFNNIYSVVNISMTEKEQVVVMEPEFLLNLVRLLDQTPVRVIANYIHWRLVLKTSENTNQLMNTASFKFWKIFYGTSDPQPRWRMCVNKVANSLGFAVGAVYIEKAFDQQAKKEAVDMISHLKDAFNQLVQESQWMDEETKTRALEKAAAMKEFVAYPDWIRNKTELTQFYHGVETNNKGYFDIVLNVTRFLEHDDLKSLRAPTDRTVWVTFPSVVNAFYYFVFNSITFPAGILQPPFFGKGRLAALNYGGMGAVIGHEITHGFDDKGRQADKNGRIKQWWTNETISRYLEGAKCFVEQYSNFTFPEFAGTEAYHINGIISQGENIADNGGVRQAFSAYQNYVAANGRELRLPGLEKYTPEQLFFLSYANIWCGKETEQALKQQVLNGPHSPGRYRVLGTLSNSVDFSHHFKCSKNSKMNRPNKCILW